MLGARDNRYTTESGGGMGKFFKLYTIQSNPSMELVDFSSIFYPFFLQEPLVRVSIVFVCYLRAKSLLDTLFSASTFDKQLVDLLADFGDDKEQPLSQKLSQASSMNNGKNFTFKIHVKTL